MHFISRAQFAYAHLLKSQLNPPFNLPSILSYTHLNWNEGIILMWRQHFYILLTIKHTMGSHLIVLICLSEIFFFLFLLCLFFSTRSRDEIHCLTVHTKKSSFILHAFPLRTIQNIPLEKSLCFELNFFFFSIRDFADGGAESVDSCLVMGCFLWYPDKI